MRAVRIDLPAAANLRDGESMSTPHQTSDREAALRFIAEQQFDPSAACAYVGALSNGLEQDLDGLDQPWMQTLRVCTSPGGEVTGAAVIEWEEEVDRSWVHGPWSTADTWDTDALPLLHSVTAQVPVRKHEMYAAIQNERLARLATRVRWCVGEANFEYSRHHEQRRDTRVATSVRRATLHNRRTVGELHDAEFPGTYANARQLLDPAGPYTVLVAERDGQILGYVAGQAQDDDTYIDFLAVHPSDRRRGIGTTLVNAFEDEMPGHNTALTVDEHRDSARRMYEAIGFTLRASTRPYRSW